MNDSLSQLKIITETPSGETAAPPLSPPSTNGDATTELAQSVLPISQKQQESISCFKNVFCPPKRGDDFTILQALFSIDMLILFFTNFCGTGGTLAAINNLGQIGSSLGYPTKSISTFVSLVSLWNFLGRVFSGFASEMFLKKYRFPRPLFLTLSLLFSCFGHLLIAFDVPNGLYFASIIIGFSFGAQGTLIMAMTSEVFGLRYYSTISNAGAMASSIASYVLNVKVVGHLYDREAARQMAASGVVKMAGSDFNCRGADCFKLAFITITAVTVLGAAVSMILVVRTRKFYRHDIYKSFREEAKVVEKMEE